MQYRGFTRQARKVMRIAERLAEERTAAADGK